MDKDKLQLSVVIPTFNRLPVLRETLKRIVRQTFPSEKFELIVIDDCSSDGTAEFLAGLRLPVSFRYFLNKENLGRAKSRNLGIKQANGNYVLMIDDDIWASPGLLEKHMEQHSHCSCEIAVTGAILVAPEVPSSTINDFLTNHHNWCYEEMKKYDGPLPYSFCKTASLSMKKDLLFQIGLFNESFIHYGGEDSELGYRLQKNDIKLCFATEAIGYHYHDETLEGLVKKETEKGMSTRTYCSLVPENKSDSQEFFTPYYNRTLTIRSVLYNAVKLVLFSPPLRSLNTMLVRVLKESERLRPLVIRYMLPSLKSQYFRYGMRKVK